MLHQYSTDFKIHSTMKVKEAKIVREVLKAEDLDKESQVPPIVLKATRK